ncbi:uncharacterized protein LOC143040992 [Oratosquilla oratoria]|uniref:uncharacterized protein LOC143040992 n=1 Tax=Oratosquilla oratoria TaxID=337810 RepID=UPI003F772183
MYQWPFSQWMQIVYGALSGKALDTFIALSESQSSDYYVLKYNILQAYQLVPEAYRQQFRKCRKSKHETHVEYFRRKLRSFTRSHPALPQSFTPTRDSKPIGPPQPPRPTAHSSSVSSTSEREDQELSHKVLLHHVYPPDSVWYFAGHHCPLLLLSGAQV